jgi:cobyrinic acid a,c-diamide synthase
MLGLMPATTRMSKRLQSLGYREATLLQDSLWGREGDRLRGHEFHYSELIAAPDWQSAYQLSPGRRNNRSEEGFQRGNVLASYLHLHFASQPSAVQHFVHRLQKCRTATPAGIAPTQGLSEGTKQ